ncbi:LytTR family DNA-binding domain-containing protein [Novosphingobium mangrovi (ex Huang et al. 2023)]|uniref:LytTR family transcriptional regulator DNA-binding domain-containing protein n=1 Tax=Novosphingobium mangrovi (ex Huang et al. 2023) TaxID=2976432 RepID=A0ABT2I0B4_9SPHN|nr:LytTR family DNA-binding domain-containing protein [Novosphingobium mangrovi (ex Huang et al. 2023)]MCT2398239.1 LytTR family transcriptional regulator DNA-binding domain-containing protein [Novosphingobium mangrovi (ex Huang et al. 2023)]
MKRDRKFYLRAGVLASCGGLALALLGPFGTYLNGPFPERLLFWMTTCCAGVLLYGFTARVLMQRWRGRVVDWLSLFLGALLASVPEAWISRALALHLWPQLEANVPAWPVWYGQTTILGCLYTLIGVQWALRQRRAADAGTPPARTTLPEPAEGAFADPGTIVALQIEDHYVRVHRAAGSQIVLMPLKRAIAVMDGIEGLQTHRSWWVARTAVAEVQGTPRSMQLRLVNGLQVPVARSAVITLRSAGWLAD